MYGNKFWHKAPFWFIPASFLWGGLELLLYHFQIVQKISDRYQHRKRLIKNSCHILCCIVAYLVTFLIIVLIKIATGIDLLNYGID